MPLTVQLDDGKRWRVCVAKARVEVQLRWTELDIERTSDESGELGESSAPPGSDGVDEGGEPEDGGTGSSDGVERKRPSQRQDSPREPRDEIPYTRKDKRLALIVHKRSGRMVQTGEPERVWEAAEVAEVGAFWSRKICFSVDQVAGGPPYTASVRLVPRSSAILAVLLLVSTILGTALLTAATLSTLHVNFSYSHALTGLGGLTVLGLAAKAASSVADELRINGLPLYGLGYLLGRTIFACVLGVGAVALLMPRVVTTVINKTEADIELKLPGAPGRMTLGPGQEMSLFGPARHVQQTVRSSFVDKETFRVEGGAEPSWTSPTVPRLEIHCAPQYYRALDPAKTASAYWTWWSPDLLVGAGVDLNNDCTAKAPAQVEHEQSRGVGVFARYHVEQPTTLDTIEGSPWLLVDKRTEHVLETLDTTEGSDEAGTERVLKTEAPPREPKDGPIRPGIRLEVSMKEPAEPAQVDHEITGGPEPMKDPADCLILKALDAKTKDSGAGTKGSGSETGRMSRPILTPHGGAAATFSVIEVTGGVERGAVDCGRDRVDIDSHFWILDVPFNRGRASQGESVNQDKADLFRLEASYQGEPSWESTWQHLNSVHKTENAMICAHRIAGEDQEHRQIQLTPSLLKLTLTVSFPNPDTPLKILMPHRYAAQQVEVQLGGEGGDALAGRGTLRCNSVDAQTDYLLRPVWVERAGEKQLFAVDELFIGESEWTTEQHPDERSGHFPPWVCLPLSKDARLGGMKVNGITPDPQVTRCQLYSDAVVKVQLPEKKGRHCYYHWRESEVIKRKQCKVVCPETPGSVWDRAKNCARITVCADDEGSCP